MKSPLVLIMLFLLLLWQHSAVSAQELVLFGTQENDYKSQLLNLALSKVPDADYRISYFIGDLPKIRAFERMEQRQGIDIIFGGTTHDREADYRAIRFPLLKGLNGWRVPLVHKDRTEIFENISSLEQFKQLKPGLYHDWSDTMVMEQNNIQVVKATNYSALYKMLDKQRFDYFPRSVLEVDGDYQEFKHFDIQIHPKVLIYYPTAYYFFVAQRDEALAAKIELGLNRAYEDGSLDTLYMQFFGDIIAKYAAHKPMVIRLQNHLLPATAPLERPELWIDLESFP